jgi:hypothetical protein
LFSETKLLREKYNIVKAIKENFDIEEFVASPVSNYRVLASVHKIFEAKIQDVTNVKDVFDAKITLVEHVSTTQTSIKKIEDNYVLDEK